MHSQFPGKQPKRSGEAGESSRALLFGVSPLDPVAFAAVPVLLATASLIASYLPARRAISVDPIETIRVE